MSYLSLNDCEISIPISNGVFRIAGANYDDDEPHHLVRGEIIKDRQSLHLGVIPAESGSLLLDLRDHVKPAIFVHEIMVYDTKLWIGSGDMSSGLMFVVQPGSHRLTLWRNERDLTGGFFRIGIAPIGPVDA